MKVAAFVSYKCNKCPITGNDERRKQSIFTIIEISLFSRCGYSCHN